MSDPSPPALPPSSLGTKEYWDATYTREVSNHASDPSDRGTIWFSSSNAQSRIVSLLASSVPHTSSILDLGCGNGCLLAALADTFSGPLLGVDYSGASIALASRVAPALAFREWDILASPYEELTPRYWDVVVDKGTFDAVCLGADGDGERRGDLYRERVLPLLRDGGLFVVTSCNWTEEELGKWFVREGDAPNGRFDVVDRVEYRTFSFGGVKGQTISTLAFRKRG